MNKVTRKMGKVVCSFALALAIFAMPTASMAVEAAGYVSYMDEMTDVQATVGDGSITFNWTWNPEFLENGYIYDSYIDMYSYMAGHEYTGNEAYIAYVLAEAVENPDAVPQLGVNAWVDTVSTDVTTWTCTGLTNGTAYYFDCYMDETEGYIALTPVAAPASNLTDDDTDNTPVVTPENSVEENITPVVTPTVDEKENNVPVVIPNEEVKGNCTSAVMPMKNALIPHSAAIFEGQMAELESKIACAEDGAVVKLDGGKDMDTLPNSIMQTLYRKGTVSLEFTFEYEDQKHVVVIPAGKAKNTDIPWYGPLYLLANYSK